MTSQEFPRHKQIEATKERIWMKLQGEGFVTHPNFKALLITVKTHKGYSFINYENH